MGLYELFGGILILFIVILYDFGSLFQNFSRTSIFIPFPWKLDFFL